MEIHERKYSYHFANMAIGVVIFELLFALSLLAFYYLLLPSIPGLRLQNGSYFWLLFSLPVLSFLFLWGIYRKNSALKRFADEQLLAFLIPSLSSAKSVTKFFLLRFAVAMILLAWINPQYGTVLEEAKYKGVDLMIAIDVSNSMHSEDIAPNRLMRAKRAIEQLLEQLHGDRIGFIVFGGEAYVQLPITTDYAAAKLFLSTIDTDVVPVQGTAIGAAIKQGLNAFDYENGSSKSIIVISDGENHEDDAINAAESAVEQGVVVHTIGMGSPQGAPIPIYKGKRQVGYKKDKDGNTVVSKLNEVMLQQVANAGNGIFIRASNQRVGLNELLDEINGMEKSEYGAIAYANYEDRYQWFLAFALVMIVLECLISSKRSSWNLLRTKVNE